MIKLNNKGFAISTILYGLLVVLILIISLLMSTMSFTRTNSKKFTDEIKTNLEKKTVTPLDSDTIKGQQYGNSISTSMVDGKCSWAPSSSCSMVAGNDAAYDDCSAAVIKSCVIDNIKSACADSSYCNSKSNSCYTSCVETLTNRKYG